MKTINYSLLTLLALLLWSTNLQAQVRIGGSLAPNANAILDLNPDNSDNASKGLLLPRVQLVATTNPAPLTTHTKGMYVFNTVTRNDVEANAAYYNDGTKWQKVVSESSITVSLGDTILNYITNNVTQELTDSIMSNVAVTGSRGIEITGSGTSTIDVALPTGNSTNTQLVWNTTTSQWEATAPAAVAGETVTNVTGSNGVYTYTNENGDTQKIDVVSDIYNYGDTLLSNQTFIDNLISNNQFLDSITNIIQISETVTNVTGSNGVYTYTNENGDTQKIDVVSDIYNYGDTLLSNQTFIDNLISNNQFLDSITNIIQISETVTNVTGSNGVYTYTNENGDTQKIDVVSDIYNYGDTLLSNTTFIDNLISNNQFLDSITNIIQISETVTNVTGSNGVYTYTNENGDTQKIDVVSDIYNYGDTLLSNTTFIDNLISNNQFLDSITNIIQISETVTNVTGSNGVYTYTNENGDTQKIDVVSDIYNYGDTLLSNTTFIDNLISNNHFLDSITNIIQISETVTNVTGSNGVYTYTNENGDTQKIDVVSDIYNYGDTLLSNQTFIDNLISNNHFLDSITNIIQISETVTNVTGSNGVYTYTNENGDTQKIDVVSDIYNYGDTLLSNQTFIDNLISNNQFLDSITNIIQISETVTNVTGSNGVYTYTNENGDAQKIDVVSDIYNYGDTLLSNQTFIDNLISNNQFLDSITNIIQISETVTNVTGSNGVYTYTNENGDTQKIDVVSDIYNYGDTLLSNTTFIDNLISNNQFLDSITNIIQISETVTNVTGSNGVYTYTNENGDTQKIDVVSDIYNYGDTLLSNTTFIDNLISNNHFLDSITNIIQISETVTNVTGSNGVYTYTNENGDTQKIDVVSDIYNYGDTLLSNQTFIDNLISNNHFLDSITNIIQISETVTNVTGSNGVYTYTNENGDTQKIDVVSDIYNYGDTLLSNTTFIDNLISNNQFLDSITNIIQISETVTNVTGSNGVYTYTNENGDTQKIDVVSDIYNYGDTLLSNTTFIDNLISNNHFLDSITNIIQISETVTNVTGSNGVYTYTNENGDTQKIDVVSDIYNYGDTLLSNQTFIDNLISNNHFLDSITNIIQISETVTNVTGSNGVYTYTNENGDTQKIDVVSDIYNYGDTLLSNQTFIDNLISNNHFLDSITNIIQISETVTNVTGSNGVYTYTNENGDTQKIDVVSDIYNYGDTLLSNQIFIDNLISNNQFLDSITNIIQISETVTNVTGSNGVYTYTNENGDAQKIDVVSDIYNYGDTLLSNQTFIDNLISNNQFLDSITNIIKQDETVTTLTKNGNIYTYTSEDGTTTDIISQKYHAGFGLTATNDTIFNVQPVEIADSIARAINNTILKDTIINLVKDNSVKVKILEIALDSIIGTQSKIFFGTTASNAETIEVVGIEPIFTGNRVMRLTKLKVDASAELNVAKTSIDWSVTIDNDNIIAAETCTLHKVLISYICKNDITNNTTGSYSVAGR